VSSQGSESFRSLLLRHRRRTGLTQRELAELADVSLRTLQDWEAGVTLPTASRLQGLIRALLLEAGSLHVTRARFEARELWTAVEREAPRMHAFDDHWLSSMLDVARPAPSRPVSPQPLERLRD